LLVALIMVFQLMPAAFAEDSGDDGRLNDETVTEPAETPAEDPAEDPTEDPALEPVDDPIDDPFNEGDEIQVASGLSDGFYLVGTMNNWGDAENMAAYKFAVNPSNSAEYMLATELEAGAEFKAIKVESENVYWIPDGTGNNARTSLTGAVTVYFSENEKGDWSGDGQSHFFVQEAVAKIGSVGYPTLEAAVAAAGTDDVIEILVAGEYTLPSLPKKVTIKGAVDGVVFSHTGSGNIASTGAGAIFNNVIFNLGNNNYHGFQHNGGLTFEGCTFNGKFFTYGNETYKNCTFTHTGDYNVGLRREHDGRL
jgi:hypothetical protein